MTIVNIVEHHLVFLATLYPFVLGGLLACCCVNWHASGGLGLYELGGTICQDQDKITK